MISHKHKCIFIHIPRTGGSSIEQSIRPDWTWKEFHDKKHIFASTAKKLYRDYWDEYFKFSFVRNPWSRMVSMSKYEKFYGVKLINGLLDVKGYLEKFPKLEIDHRSKSKGEKFDFICNAVYLNILNEELDFVGRFENIEEDYYKVCSIINCTNKLQHLEASKTPLKHYSEYYDDKTRKIVAEKYKRDIETFGYEF